jgi:hypothetical protein
MTPLFNFTRIESKKTGDSALRNDYYSLLRKPKKKSPAFHDNPRVHKRIIRRLERSGFSVPRLRIDVQNFRDYLRGAAYEKFADYCKGGHAESHLEKYLEHYLAARLLNLSPNDVYIDVASGNSPVAQIYSGLYGCTAYQQDIRFPAGLNGNMIGGDAADMPVGDGFATKMALHCSLEHFEGDSDIWFIKESRRVLHKGGKLCIAPLYLFTEYAIQTDPAIAAKDSLTFDNDAVLYCAQGWGERHARFYDVPHLVSRIRNNLGELKLTIFAVENAKEIDASCYVKFVALFERTY